MERSQEIFEQIEAYIDGDLTGAELEMFQKALTSDPELQREVEKHAEIKSALQDKEVIDFRKKLVKINEALQEEQKSTPKIKPFYTVYWKLAASIVILIGVSTFLYLNTSQQNDMFAMYYTPFPMEDITRGDENTVGDDLKSISRAYKNGNYKEAIPHLEKMMKEAPDNDKLKLYLGNSYINTDNIDGAIQQFENIKKESKYYDDRLWFVALCYLKLEQTQQASQILKTLTSRNSIYNQKARKLLNQLHK